jgi:hypothetical protein
MPALRETRAAAFRLQVLIAQARMGGYGSGEQPEVMMDRALSAPAPMPLAEALPPEPPPLPLAPGSPQDVLRLLLPQLVALDALARLHGLDGLARHLGRAVDWADAVLTAEG